MGSTVTYQCDKCDYSAGCDYFETYCEKFYEYKIIDDVNIGKGFGNSFISS